MTYAAPFVWNGGTGNSGLTLTVTLRDSAYVSVTSGLTGVAEVGSTGIYRWYYAAFADGFVGFVELLSGSTVKTVFPVSPADAADILPAIKAKTDTLGGATVTVVAPVTDAGSFSIIQGDDYQDTDGRSLEWTNAGGTWPDLTSATITFTMDRGSEEFAKTGSVIVPTGVGQKVRIELTKAETAARSVGGWSFSVRAKLASNNREITLVSGWLSVVAVPL